MNENYLLAIEHLVLAIQHLNLASQNENDFTLAEQERLRAAWLLLHQTRMAIECGGAYPTTGRAEEFDNLNREK